MKRCHSVLLAIAITPHIIHAAPSKLLDAIRWEESRNESHAVNYNKNGTRDLGPYQLNSAYLDDFRWRYNKGKKINPFSEKEARFISNAHLDRLHNYFLSGASDCGATVASAWYKTVVAWNCGANRYMRGAPQSSRDFAARVLNRAGMGK